MNLPTEQQCLDYFKQYKVPKNILEHCLLVRKVAVFLANKLKSTGEKINIELVNCLALLHDLFKAVTLKSLEPNKHHNYQYSEEETTMWKHLREKYPNMHEGDVAYLVFKEDYPEFALSLKRVSNPRAEKNREESIVHYADWRVLQKKIVTLQERLNYLKETYPRETEAWEGDETIVLEFEEKLMEVINIQPDDLAEEINHE